MTLLDDLRAEGVRVVEEPNWRKHARPGPHQPVGVIVHHTAGHKDLAVVRDGRADLAGPLSNVWQAKTGDSHLVSAGRCNHAGKGSGFVLREVRAGKAPMGAAAARHLADDTDGNTWFYGIEVENLGDGRDPYPLAQVTGLVRCCAAFCRRHGWTASHVIGHREWTRRKPDPTLDMAWLRRLVASQLAQDQEDDVTEETGQAILAELRTLNQLVQDGVVAKLGRMGGDNFRIKARLGLPDKATEGEVITPLGAP